MLTLHIRSCEDAGPDLGHSKHEGDCLDDRKGAHSTWMLCRLPPWRPCKAADDCSGGAATVGRAPRPALPLMRAILFPTGECVQYYSSISYIYIYRNNNTAQTYPHINLLYVFILYILYNIIHIHYV